MKNSFTAKCLLIAVAAPLFAGCVEREVVYRDRPVPPPSGQPMPPSTVIVEQEPPPPPPVQVEVVPVCPGPTTVWFWAPGCWEWRGHWVWAGGRWMARPHPGAVWIGAHWGVAGHHRVWVHGGWR
jgi:hypothetical protein